MRMFNFDETSRPCKRLVGGLALALAVTAGLPNAATAQEINSEGWTILRPASDTRFVFVSSSEGDDRNSGRSPAQAVRTIARAKQLMRSNAPDWLLLKRGDTWRETFGAWKNSGRSESERVVIASYGDSDARPKIICDGNNHGITAPYGDNVSHVAVVGIHFEAERPADGAGGRGVRWQSIGKDLLIEDCYIGNFFSNVTIEGLEDGFEDAILRRNVIVDAWSLSGHSQGVFINRTVGVVMEENFIDRNGWDPNIDGADADTFRQNVYIQAGVTDVVFKGNITSRAAAAGVQVRSGAIAENNLFYANPTAMRFGYATLEWPAEAATGSIRNNVVLGGPLAREVNEVFGLWTERLRDTVIEGNVVAKASDGQEPIAYTIGGIAKDVTFRNNVTFKWNRGTTGQALKTSAEAVGPVTVTNNFWVMPSVTSRIVNLRYSANMQFDNNAMEGITETTNSFAMDGSNMRFSQWNSSPNVGNDRITDIRFADEGRDLRKYAQHLGLTDEASFIAAARQISRKNWNPAFTGTAASEWIRAGYQVIGN